MDAYGTLGATGRIKAERKNCAGLRSRSPSARRATLHRGSRRRWQVWVNRNPRFRLRSRASRNFCVEVWCWPGSRIGHDMSCSHQSESHYIHSCSLGGQMQSLSRLRFCVSSLLDGSSSAHGTTLAAQQNARDNLTHRNPTTAASGAMFPEISTRYFESLYIVFHQYCCSGEPAHPGLL